MDYQNGHHNRNNFTSSRLRQRQAIQSDESGVIVFI